MHSNGHSHDAPMIPAPVFVPHAFFFRGVFERLFCHSADFGYRYLRVYGLVVDAASGAM